VGVPDGDDHLAKAAIKDEEHKNLVGFLSELIHDAEWTDDHSALSLIWT
jgi:hypothetical protein